MASALITGIAGFAGSHLADFLLARDWRVCGLVTPGGVRGNLRHLPERVTLYECDLRDRAAMNHLFQSAAFDSVFHLAAKTIERDTRAEPRTAFDVNVLGTMNLLDAIKSAGQSQTRVLIAGSSAQYGLVHPDENPITETQPFRPVGIYGVTKASQALLALQYHLAHGMPIVQTIAFNHAGPRQSEHFSTASFASQIAGIELGRAASTLKVGDLSHRRDLTDVRDVVRGYVDALMHGKPGETYNIATGVAVRTRDVLDQLLAMATVNIDVQPDPDRMRPADVPSQIGDAGKLHKLSGWQPQFSLQQTLQDTLNFWRQRLKEHP